MRGMNAARSAWCLPRFVSPAVSVFEYIQEWESEGSLPRV